MQIPSFLLKRGITQIATLDFETFYSIQYTLSKMSTSLYIFDNQFLAHGLGIKINGKDTKYYSNDINIRKALHEIDWSKTAVLAHHCLTPDTEVLTHDGWKKIPEVDVKTPIMQWDSESETASWVTPLNKTETYANNINIWDSNYHQGAYTNEHRMYYSTPKLKAWRSNTCSEIKKLAPNNVYIPKSGLYAGTTAIINAEAKLLEAIRADANLIISTSAVRFRLTKKEKINRLKKILKDLTLSYKETITNVTSIYIYSCETLKKLRSLFEKNKTYGKKIQELSLENRISILKETQYWDGHKKEKGKSIDLYSIDKSTIDTLQIIAHTSGWSANYHKPKFNNWKTKNTLYGISLRDTNKCKLQYQPKEKNYTGKVYCFTVPDKAFFIRRNEVVNITGNCQFDALIMFYHYGIKPTFYLDTLSMARPVLQNVLKKLNLDTIAKHFGIQGKLDGLEDTKGVRELNQLQSIRLGIYCKNDVDITIPIFEKLLPYFTDMELEIIHYTIKMYADPKLIVDEWLVDKEITYVQNEKKLIFNRVKDLFPIEFQAEDVVKVLRSGDKLARVLEYNGILSPKKISKTTNKETHAFARTDLAFQKLGDGSNPTATLLHDARLVSKSDTALNKAIILKRFAIAACCPVYLNYWKAQTGRFTGGDKIQLQNLPRDGAARFSLLAPEGHVLLVCDLSQIELRMSAWFSGQQDVLDIFISGKDVYKDMATKIYNVPYDKVTKAQRMVAKVTCVSARTQVLTNNGWKPIVKVLITDKIWNGKKWARHKGVISRGCKKTKNLLGLSLTPGHLVSYENDWKTAEILLQNENMLLQTLKQHAENLPLQDIYLQKKVKDTQEYWLSVHAQIKNIQQIYTELQSIKQNTAKTVLESKHLKLAIEQQWKLCQTLCIENDYLTAFQQLYQDVIVVTTNAMPITNLETLLCTLHGEKIKVLSLSTSKLFLDGIIQISKWIDQTIMEIMNQEIYNFLHQKKTWLTDEIRCVNKWKYSKPQLDKCKSNWINLNSKQKVYDLLDCENGNKFTVATLGGPMLIHNCLGLGYGAGIQTFENMLKAGAMGPKIDLGLAEVRNIHTTYRKANDKIVKTWKKAGEWLEYLLIDRDKGTKEYKGLKFSRERVDMPNGTFLNYHNMTIDEYNGCSYQGANGMRKRIYSSLFFENLIQALARHVIAEQLVHVARQYDVVLSVHDELIVSVPFLQVNEATQFVEKIMRTSPSWCKDLPLDCESGAEIEYSK